MPDGDFERLIQVLARSSKVFALHSDLAELLEAACFSLRVVEQTAECQAFVRIGGRGCLIALRPGKQSRSLERLASNRRWLWTARQGGVEARPPFAVLGARLPEIGQPRRECQLDFR